MRDGYRTGCGGYDFAANIPHNYFFESQFDTPTDDYNGYAVRAGIVGDDPTRGILYANHDNLNLIGALIP